MICRETYAWLLASRPGEALPSEVQQHLQQCSACRRYQQRLALLHEQASALPAPADNPRARQALLASLENVPQERPAVRMPSNRSAVSGAAFRRPARLAAVAAARVLLSAGTLIGYGLASKRQRSKAVTDQDAGAE